MKLNFIFYQLIYIYIWSIKFNSFHFSPTIKKAYFFLSNLFVSYFFAYFISVFFELPLVGIEKFLFRQRQQWFAANFQQHAHNNRYIITKPVTFHICRQESRSYIYSINTVGMIYSHFSFFTFESMRQTSRNLVGKIEMKLI